MMMAGGSPSGSSTSRMRTTFGWCTAEAARPSRKNRLRASGSPGGVFHYLHRAALAGGDVCGGPDNPHAALPQAVLEAISRADHRLHPMLGCPHAGIE